MSTAREQPENALPGPTPEKPRVPKRKRGVLTRRGKERPLTAKDGIFDIVGIGESKVEGGFSWRKHELGI